MTPIPSDIDALLWTVAERGNDRAIDEFGRRHPQYRTELLRRIDLVKNLKEAKVASIGVVPNFNPRRLPLRFSWVTIGAPILGGLAFGSYWMTSRMTQSAAPAQYHYNHMGACRPWQHLGVPSMPQGSLMKAVPGSLPPEYLTTISYHVERADLITILKELSQQGGLSMELAPGMQNPEIRVDYDQKSIIDILQDLGKKYGFTPYLEGNGQLLVVPALERSPQSPPNL
jgi:hypothetical protein